MADTFDTFNKLFIDLGDIADEYKKTMRIAFGLPDPPNYPGYLGNRCGWYPEKPKRKRKNR